MPVTPAVKETFNHRSETRDSNRTPSKVIVISRDGQLIVFYKPFLISPSERALLLLTASWLLLEL